MNKHKEDFLKLKTTEYLNKLILDKGFIKFESISSQVTALQTELEKTLSKWLGFYETYLLLKNEIDTFLELNKANEYTGHFVSKFTPEQIEELANKIVNTIKKLPAEYFFFFQLPNLNLDFNLKWQITEDISLVKILYKDLMTIIEDQSIKGIKYSPEDEGIVPSGNYLRIKVVGYAVESDDSIIYLNALSKLKQFIFLSSINGSITLNNSYTDYKYRNNKKVIFIDKETSNKTGIIKLTEHFSNVLAGIEFSEKYIQKFHEYINYKEDTSENKSVFSMLGRPGLPALLGSSHLEILESNEDEKIFMPIKNSLEWGFDSITNRIDKKISLIQLSVALEAILGDEKNSQLGVTEKLADRCSYLIGRNIVDRKKIKEDFMKFYDLRSKLVHGRISTLSNDNKLMLYWGQDTLEKVLKREMTPKAYLLGL